MRLPKMSQLVAFHAVVKHGSINAAAKSLNMAQPSLSRSIKELEELLNVQLIVRGSAGVTLTPSGVSFATNTSMILETTTRAIDESYMLSGKTDMLLRFGLSTITARSIAQPALTAFMREFPNCRFHVDDNPIERHMEQLKNGFLDFATGNASGDVSFAGVSVDPLFECPFYICCAKGHPLENARHLSELTNADWWITGEHRIMERENLEFKMFNLRRSMSTRAFIVGAELLLKNQFLALLSTVQIKSLGASVSVIPIENFNCIGRFSIFRAKNRPLTRAAERMIALMHIVADHYDFSLPKEFATRMKE